MIHFIFDKHLGEGVEWELGGSEQQHFRFLEQTLMLLRHIHLNTLLGFTYLPAITHKLFPTNIQTATGQLLYFCCPSYSEMEWAGE